MLPSANLSHLLVKFRTKSHFMLNHNQSMFLVTILVVPSPLIVHRSARERYPWRYLEKDFCTDEIPF